MDTYPWTSTPEQIAAQTGISVLTIYSWIQQGLWTHGQEYIFVSGWGHGGRNILIDQRLFANFKPGERYIKATEAARLLRLTGRTFRDALGDELEYVELPVKRIKGDPGRLYPLSVIQQYQKERDALFLPGVIYLTHNAAGAFLGVGKRRMTQIRQEGKVQKAVYISVGRNHWWYPLPELQRLRALKQR